MGLRQWLTGAVLVLSAVLVLGGAAVAVVALRWQSTTAGTVYTPGQIEAGLFHHPTAWAGRSILVRATVLDVRQTFPLAPAFVVLAPPLPAQRPPHQWPLGRRLVLAFHLYQRDMLLVRTVPPAVLVSALHRLPVLGGFLPPSQRGDAYSSGVYRIQLAASHERCAQASVPHDCYDAVIADYLP